MTKSNEVTIGDDDAAVVISPDGVKLVTPEKGDDEVIGHNVQFAVMLAYLLSTDAEWVKSVIKRFEESSND